LKDLPALGADRAYNRHWYNRWRSKFERPSPCSTLANKIFLLAAHLHPGKKTGEVICAKTENVTFVRIPGFLLGFRVFELAFVFFLKVGVERFMSCMVVVFPPFKWLWILSLNVTLKCPCFQTFLCAIST
jgi:hypothetical protein